MAFTKEPIGDTYSSQQITLTREISSRDGGSSGKDEDLVNVFVEVIKNRPAEDNRHFVVKRAGSVKIKDSVASLAVRGTYFWEDQNKVFYAVSDDIYVYNVNDGTSSVVTDVFATTSGTVGFTLFLYDDNTSKVVATDGDTLLTIDSAGTHTVCVDADLPDHLPYPVFIDGYLFLAQRDSGDIWNSDLNDPLAWTAGNFITAEMEGDYLVRIAKLNNYLIAMGTSSIEYFWDAGNATGSPMQRNDTPIKMNRYLAGFAQIGNDIYYVGVNDGGQPDVYLLRDFKIQSVGTPFISRYLNEAQNGTSNWYAGVVAFKGHTFYVLNAGTTRTYVFDVEQRLWARWAFKQNSIFDLRACTGIVSTTSAVSYFFIGATSTLYQFSDTSKQDDGTSFSCVITTENNAFGTMNRKTMSKAKLIVDRPPVDANMLVQWSDDDYQNFNTGVSINLNQDLPVVYRLGSFRQRIFKLTYTSDQDLRAQNMEVDINKGRS